DNWLADQSLLFAWRRRHHVAIEQLGDGQWSRLWQIAFAKPVCSHAPDAAGTPAGAQSVVCARHGVIAARHRQAVMTQRQICRFWYLLPVARLTGLPAPLLMTTSWAPSVKRGLLRHGRPVPADGRAHCAIFACPATASGAKWNLPASTRIRCV